MEESQRTGGRRTSTPPFSPKRMQGTVAPAPGASFNATTSFAPNTESPEPLPQHQFKKSKEVKRRKYSRWHILRRRMKRRGVVPVNKEHPNFKYLSCIKEGIRFFFNQESEIETKDTLTPSDFERVVKANLNFDGQEFEFESYADSVFATLRHAIGIGESTYIGAVAPSNLPYLEFISNSKSGQDFFLSNDMQFMFKSNRKRDVTFFLSMLKDYLQHFIAYPHSLLVKYVGCYSIQLKGKRKKYLLAMQSIFFPADRIEDRFDIKGCTAGRYQKPNKPGSNIITVLKDQNFITEELDFGDESDWFVSQIKADSTFLKDLNCMDYSLLLGRQRKHPLEKQPDSVSSLINRIGHSISPVKSVMAPLRLSTESLTDTIDSDHQPASFRSESLSYSNNNNKSNISHTNGSIYYISSTCPTARSETSATREIPGTVTEDNSSDYVTLPKVTPGLMFPRSLIEGVDRFYMERRRLLPKCKNALHVIDGRDYRYFIGIVDFLTRFDWRQKFAQYWKLVKYRCGDHSTKHPDVYARRFVNNLRDKVK